MKTQLTYLPVSEDRVIYWMTQLKRVTIAYFCPHSHLTNTQTRLPSAGSLCLEVIGRTEQSNK